MNKEIISYRQGIYIIIIFFTGSIVLVGTSIKAKQDVWISLILTTLLSIPMLYIYSKLLTVYPGKNLFDVLTIVFGKFLGKVISILFVLYFLYLGTQIIRNFSEYVSIVSLPETPQIVSVIFIGLLCILMVKSGLEVMGRWSSFATPIIFFIILFTILLSSNNIKFSNFKPVLYDGFSPVLSTSLLFLFFPFLEVVVLLTMFNKLNDTRKTFKVFLYGMLIGSLAIFLILMRNLTVLSPNLANDVFFPSILEVELITVGVFIERIEIVVSIVFIFGVLVKISSCLLATTIGISKIFNINNYRYLVAPIGLAMMSLSLILYNNTLEILVWMHTYYPYLAFPFQIVFPIVTLIVAKIKIKKQNKKPEAYIVSEKPEQGEYIRSRNIAQCKGILSENTDSTENNGNAQNSDDAQSTDNDDSQNNDDS